MTLTLYEHPFALYCQKVIFALRERQLEFDVKVENEDFTREELRELWPIASIPVLRDGDRVVAETSIIVEYLDSLDAGGPKLIPDDPEEALQARFWDRVCDAYISDSVQTVVFDALKPDARKDPEAVGAARATFATAYDMLEKRLADNEWLAGPVFSIADCAAAPGLFYAWAVNPWSEQSYPGITAYYRRLSARPSYAQVIEDARPYRDLFPLEWPEDIDRHHRAD
jgi:glutathione S-transferase